MLTLVLPLSFLTALNVAAQSRIAVTGGFNFARRKRKEFRYE